MNDEIDLETKDDAELSDMFENYKSVLSAVNGDSSRASKIWNRIKTYRSGGSTEMMSIEDIDNDDMEFGDTDEKARLDKLLGDLGVRVGRKTLVTIFFNGSIDEITDPYYMYTILRMNRVRTDKIATILSFWYEISPIKIRKLMSNYEKKFKAEGGLLTGDADDDDDEEEDGEGKGKYKKASDIVESMTENKLRELEEELELKKKEAELAKLERIISGEYGNTVKKEKSYIEIPFTDPDGNPVFDANGNVVMVKVDPDEEMKRRQVLALMSNNKKKAPEEEGSSTLAAILQAMMQQQNQMFQLFMEKNKGSEVGTLEMLREEMRHRDERHAQEVAQMSQIIAQMRNDEIENKLNQLAYAVSNRGDEIDNLLVKMDKLKQLGLVGGDRKTPEERALDMQMEAMRNSYEMVKSAQAGIGRELSKVVDLGTSIIREEYQRDLADATRKPRTNYTDDEMEAMAREVGIDED
jgi:hypothetical protein